MHWPRTARKACASPRNGSFGHNLYTNLRDSGFRGVLYPVNPNRRYIETVPAIPGTPATPNPDDDGDNYFCLPKTSGASTEMPIARHSPMYLATLSLEPISEVSMAAMKWAG